MGSNNRLKVKVNVDTGMVTLKLERRDAYNRPTQTTSFTMSRRAFERALNLATIEVPWRKLDRS